MIIIIGILYFVGAVAVAAVLTFLGYHVGRFVKKHAAAFGKVVALTVVLVAVTVLFGGVLYGALAEELRAGVVVSADRDTGLVVLLDSCGIAWEYEFEDDVDVYEIDVYDLMLFELIPVGDSDKITDDAITQPQYSGIKVDKHYVDQLITKYYAE